MTKENPDAPDFRQLEKSARESGHDDAADALASLRQQRDDIRDTAANDWTAAVKVSQEYKARAETAERERDEAEQQVEVLQPGGLYAWKSKYEAECCDRDAAIQRAETAERERDEWKQKALAQFLGVPK